MMKTIKALKSKWTQPILKKAFKENNSRYPKDLKEDIKKVSENEVPNSEIAEALKIDASYISKWLAKPASKKKATKKKATKKKEPTENKGKIVKYGFEWDEKVFKLHKDLLKHPKDLLFYIHRCEKLNKKIKSHEVFEENIDAASEALVVSNYLDVLSCMSERLEGINKSHVDVSEYSEEMIFMAVALKGIVKMLDAYEDFLTNPNLDLLTEFKDKIV